MASIQDVAKKAKVGVGTVSRVLSGNGYVADTTKKRVERAIKALDYKPNELARNLLHNRTNIIGVIIPDVENPFFATLVNEIETELRKHGYKTMLCNTVGEKTNEEAYLDMLERNMVDGILTGSHTLDSSRYEQLKRPIVAFDTPILSKEIPVITVDHKKGGYLAAKALIDSGCKEVIQFTDETDREGFPFLERHEEFRRVLAKAGVICHDYIMEWNMFDNAYFKKAVQHCYDKYPNADGVFGTDSLALYYMKLAQMNGKNVPEDLKVVAYDGTNILNLVYPTVTAIAQPIKDLAITGVNELLNLIKGEEPKEQRIQLNLTFQQGNTTN